MAFKPNEEKKYRQIVVGNHGIRGGSSVPSHTDASPPTHTHSLTPLAITDTTARPTQRKKRKEGAKTHVVVHYTRIGGISCAQKECVAIKIKIEKEM